MLVIAADTMLVIAARKTQSNRLNFTVFFIIWFRCHPAVNISRNNY
jgi:hypothetical protein